MSLPSYLGIAWESEFVRQQIAQFAKTTAGIWKVSQSDLERVVIPLPTLEEQTQIVNSVDAVLACANRVEAPCAAAGSLVERVTSLLLAKAFRGELVDQDPNDEPASELLSRLDTQYSQAAVLTKPPKPRAPRAPQESHAMTKSRHDEDVMGKPYLARHLRRLGAPSSAEALFKIAELPVADFYKQLAWEVAQGHVKDQQALLEPGDAS